MQGILGAVDLGDSLQVPTSRGKTMSLLASRSLCPSPGMINAISGAVGALYRRGSEAPSARIVILTSAPSMLSHNVYSLSEEGDVRIDVRQHRL